jgi:hypothetical protein
MVVSSRQAFWRELQCGQVAQLRSVGLVDKANPMGSINVKIVVLSAHLGPNESDTWSWNNPLLDTVYAFSAVTHSDGSPADANLKVEISTLKYNRNLSTGKRRIEYTVKNLTPHPLSYEVHMSRATPI